MKTSNRRIEHHIALLVLAISISACSGHYKVIYPDALKSTVEELDSITRTLPEFDFDDENLAHVREHFCESCPLVFDTARNVWNKFVSLCRQNKFKKAYDYFYTDDNQAYFPIHLRNSSERYLFDEEVLMPLILEFNDIDAAREKYIDILSIEEQMEATTMYYSAGKTDYIPESLPHVIKELGTMFVAMGQEDRMMDLLGDYACAIDGMVCDSLFTHLAVAALLASIYEEVGNPPMAIEFLEHYIENTMSNMDPELDSLDYEPYLGEARLIIEHERAILTDEVKE